MNNKLQNNVVVGVDTGKKQIDLHVLPSDEFFSVTNDAQGISGVHSFPPSAARPSISNKLNQISNSAVEIAAKLFKRISACTASRLVIRKP